MDLTRGYWVGTEFFPFPSVAASQPRQEAVGQIRAAAAGLRASGAGSRPRSRSRSRGPPANSSVGRALALAAERNHAPNTTRDAIISAAASAQSATALGQAVARANLDRLTRGKYLTALRDYVRVCNERGECDQPITAAKVVALLADYVAVRGNQGPGMSQLLSRLTGACQGAGLQWLSPTDDAYVRGQMRTLASLFPYVVQPAAAITYAELDVVVASLQAQPGLASAQLVAMMLLAHDAMLRGSEFCDGHLLVKDVEVVEEGAGAGRGGLELSLYFRKMSKVRQDTRETGTKVVRKHHQLRDTVKAVREYITAAGLKPDDPLFQLRDPETNSVTNANGFPYPAFTLAVRAAFRAAGVPNADCYTGRGLRAGGHTDLYREVQDFELIGLLGGWKSARAQALYLRAQKINFSFLSDVIGDD